jgi:uncharacterized protein (DUF2062 family)
MGILPVWGFQLIIAIALAFALKLNKVLVILAANISIPPMIPLILFLSHLTGSVWMGEQAQRLSFSDEITFETMKASFIQYLSGAVTLAVVAGLLFTLLTYAGLKIFRRTKI